MEVGKIFSKRLVLRKIQKKDLAIISDWTLTGEAYGKYLTQENINFQECENKFQNNFFWNKHSKTYIITLKNNLPIGTIHYWLKSTNENCAIVQIKISIPSMRNNGYGTETQKALINNLFMNSKINMVEMSTDIDNIPEQRCLIKLGFNLNETTEYKDNNITRIGNVYTLSKEKHKTLAIYKYHYE